MKEKNKTYLIHEHPFCTLCLTYVQYYKYFSKYYIYYNLMDKTGNIESRRVVKKVTLKEQMIMSVWLPYEANQIECYRMAILYCLPGIIKRMEEEDLFLVYGGVYSASDVKEILGFNNERKLETYEITKKISEKFCSFDNNDMQKYLQDVINESKSKS